MNTIRARARLQMLTLMTSVALTLDVLAAGLHWSGPDISFDNQAGGPLVTDVLIPSQVAFARRIQQGLYNAALEPSYSSVNGSPVGTVWAVSGLNGNPVFSYGAAANTGAGLVFSDWASAYGGAGTLSTNILARPAVLKIPGGTPAEDIYVDIAFTTWGQTPGAGGRFAYTRSTPPASPSPIAVPLVPGFAELLCGGLFCVLARRGRRTKGAKAV